MATKIIGLSGPSGSGKSEAAKHLADAHGLTAIKFALPLKTMLRAYYATQGLSEAETERRIEGDLKEVPDPYLSNQTPRHAMETLGTEWGRICIAPDFWIDAWKRKVSLTEGVVVTDDCRFDNEAETIKALGGSIVRLKPKVRRRKKSEHVAESGLSDRFVDHEIINDGTIDDLKSKVSISLESPE
ncbi:deoxynucleotide monophosphate kinase [Sinorhizobium medicae]|uniref:deoxynucleotide monophosphate kinase family protein n=1 Tax=Sinorhizobium medicae TaxID=110321 RepID=UPI000FD95646|nr:deoxynucleotide monophosphate kinase [Sinorhizobium medicae]RVH83234.1 deoxynucleotide monophosphate kinase [Sinorhizobium medicae]RVP63869.1 deoxynucleotide monophosphate kinase [Sinorhizobium medicae]